MKLIKKVNLILKNPRLVREMISFIEYGYFVDTGWINSYRSTPQDAKGNPLPWLTYPFIQFINDRLNKSMTVFEYGSGSSTHYFADKVKQVYSVEHDKDWYKKVADSLEKNCTVFYKELDDGYVDAISKVNTNFDLILVDGRKRVACVENAIGKLNENGVLVLDNSERAKYKPAFEFMLNKGFKKIDFFGIPPGLVMTGCTTVFYRSNNCLNI